MVFFSTPKNNSNILHAKLMQNQREINAKIDAKFKQKYNVSCRKNLEMRAAVVTALLKKIDKPKKPLRSFSYCPFFLLVGIFFPFPFAFDATGLGVLATSTHWRGSVKPSSPIHNAKPRLSRNTLTAWIQKFCSGESMIIRRACEWTFSQTEPGSSKLSLGGQRSHHSAEGETIHA